MPKVLQFRRASTATIAATLGALGEVFYNTDTKTLATFDGTTTGGTALATAASVSSTSSILSTIINNQSSTLVGYINAQDSSISSTLTVNYTAADSSQSSILTTNYKAADSSLNATINFVSSTLYTGYTSSIGSVTSNLNTLSSNLNTLSSNLNTLSSNTWRSATSSTLGLVRPNNSSITVTSGVITLNNLVHMTSVSLALVGTSVGQTYVDFTNIPFWVKRITAMFHEVNSNGTSDYLFQLGNFAGIDTTNYYNYTVRLGTTTPGSGSSFSDGFHFQNNNSAELKSGQIIFTRLSSESAGFPIWTALGFQVNDTDNGAPTGGSHQMSISNLETIRFTTANGTDQFNNGVINILYE